LPILYRRLGIVSRIHLAAVLAFSLSGIPYPARVAVVGVISHAERARVGDTPASTGTTVFDGDRLSTEAGGILRLNAGTMALHLAPQTSVSLGLTPAGQTTEVQLWAGTLVFSSEKPLAIAVCADNAWIRPASAPSSAQIRNVNRKELLISAQRGSLQFFYEGETATIPEGVTYRVLLDPDDDTADKSTSGPPGKKPGKARKPYVFSAVVAAAAVTAIMLTPHHESPDHPGHPKPHK
jgi:hypothetical protein